MNDYKETTEYKEYVKALEELHAKVAEVFVNLQKSVLNMKIQLENFKDLLDKQEN